MRYGPILLGTLVVAVVGVTGCGSSAVAGDAGTAPGIVVVGLDTMRFNPDTISAKPGEPVTITFRNGGVLPHDLITEGADRNVKLTNVASGKQASGVFLANKPGTYAVVCIQPAHKEAGMVGKVVVE